MVALGNRRPGHVSMQQSDEFTSQALDLRLQGLTYERIARRLDCSIEGARRAVMRGLDRMRTESAEVAAEVRELERARLERIDESLSDMEARTEDESTRLAIIDRRLRVADRRARLLGLDLQRVEVTGAGGGAITIQAIQRVIIDPLAAAKPVLDVAPAALPETTEAVVIENDATILQSQK